MKKHLLLLLVLFSSFGANAYKTENITVTSDNTAASSVASENDTVSDYVVNYVTAGGMILQGSTTHTNAQVGSEVTASAGELSKILVDGVIYNYTSGNDAITVAADASQNVINLVFTPVEGITGYYLATYEDGKTPWTTSIEGRFDPIVVDGSSVPFMPFTNKTCFASVNQNSRNNNGAALNLASLGIEQTNYTFEARLMLGSSNSLSTTNFLVKNLAVDANILEVKQIEEKGTSTWTINGKTTVVLPNSGSYTGEDVNNYANYSWYDFKVTVYKGYTFVTITDAEGNAILDKEQVETSALTYGVGALQFNSSRYYANFGIDDILVRSVADADIPDDFNPIAITVNYVDIDGNIVKPSETIEINKGDIVKLTSIHTNDFKVDARGVVWTSESESVPVTKYIYISDNSDEVIAAEGANVNVVFRSVASRRVAFRYQYQHAKTHDLMSKDATDANLPVYYDSQIAGDILFEGDIQRIYYPYYLLVDGYLYKTSPNSNDEAHIDYIVPEGTTTLLSYPVTWTPATEEIDYEEALITNAIFAEETENIPGMTVVKGAYTTIRMANGAAGSAIGGDILVTELLPGKYTITTATRSGTTNFIANGNVVCTITSLGTVTTVTSEEFEITKPTPLYIEEQATTSQYCDYVLIRKTGDVDISYIRIIEHKINFAREIIADENFNTGADYGEVERIIELYQQYIEDGTVYDQVKIEELADMLDNALKAYIDVNSEDISHYFANIGIAGMDKYNRGTIADGQIINNFIFRGDNWLHGEGTDFLNKQIQGVYTNSAGSVALYHTNIPAGKYYIAGEVRNAYCDKNYEYTYTLEKEVKIFVGSNMVSCGTIKGQDFVKFYYVGELKEGETFEAGFWWEGHDSGSSFQVKNFEVRGFGDINSRIAYREAWKEFITQWNAATAARNTLVSYKDNASYPWEQDSLQRALAAWDPYYNEVLGSWIDSEGNDLGKATTAELEEWAIWQGNFDHTDDYQYQVVLGFQNARNYVEARNTAYINLVEKVAEAKAAVTNPNYAHLDASDLNAVIEKAEALIKAVTTTNQSDDFNKAEDALQSVLRDFYNAGASFFNPFELTVVNPDFMYKTENLTGGEATTDASGGWNSYTSNTYEYWRIGDGGQNENGEYIYEGRNRAAMWRGWTGNPVGSLTQDITVTKAGHYAFKCQAYATGDNAAIINGVRHINIETEMREVWDEDLGEMTEQEVEISRDTTYISGIRLLFGSVTEMKIDSVDIWTSGDEVGNYNPQWFMLEYDKATDGEEVLRFGMSGLEGARFNTATYRPNAYGLGSVHVLYGGSSDKWYEDKKSSQNGAMEQVGEKTIVQTATKIQDYLNIVTPLDDIADIAAALEVEDPADITFYHLPASGEGFSSDLSDGWGAWLNSNGNYCTWGNDARVMVAYDIENGVYSIQTIQMAGTVTDGDVYSFPVYLVNEATGKYYTINFTYNVKVVDIDPSTWVQEYAAAYDVQLISSDGYAQDESSKTYLDLAAIAAAIGTEYPTLYGESWDGNKVTYSDAYSLSPDPGFWMASDGISVGYWGTGSAYGMSYDNGVITYYAMPDDQPTGATYESRFYLVNEDNGKYAKITLHIEYVDNCGGASSYIIVNAENFPDDKFRNYLLHQPYGEYGYITYEEIESITSMDVSNSNISSLQGIEYFTALTTLYCNNNQIATIDVSNHHALTVLLCYDNLLSTLDISQNTKLTHLDCSGNALTTLGTSNNPALTWLYCHNNQLSALDLSQNTVLRYLYCHDNNLSTLDVSRNTELKSLECYNNNISDYAMDTFISSLPMNIGGEPQPLRLFTDDMDEGNYCTMEQAQAIKAKGWTPMVRIDGVWVEYERPTAITLPDAEAENDNNAEYYTLDGVRIEKPTKKGIYIKNGKKVIIK